MLLWVNVYTVKYPAMPSTQKGSRTEVPRELSTLNTESWMKPKHFALATTKQLSPAHLEETS